MIKMRRMKLKTRDQLAEAEKERELSDIEEIEVAIYRLRGSTIGKRAQRSRETDLELQEINKYPLEECKLGAPRAMLSCSSGKSLNSLQHPLNALRVSMAHITLSISNLLRVHFKVLNSTFKHLLSLSVINLKNETIKRAQLRCFI